jgi:hypothetical protein
MRSSSMALLLLLLLQQAVVLKPRYASQHCIQLLLLVLVIVLVTVVYVSGCTIEACKTCCSVRDVHKQGGV